MAFIQICFRCKGKGKTLLIKYLPFIKPCDKCYGTGTIRKVTEKI